MKLPEQESRPERREFLLALAAAGAGAASSSYGFGQLRLPEAGTVLDKLWMFGSPVNSDYVPNSEKSS